MPIKPGNRGCRPVRSDLTHKLTTRLCREDQTVVIEDLHVKGMLANGLLARWLSDIGFGRIRTQLPYKALRYGTHVIVADRWFASSKRCSGCSFKHARVDRDDPMLLRIEGLHLHWR